MQVRRMLRKESWATPAVGGLGMSPQRMLRRKGSWSGPAAGQLGTSLQGMLRREGREMVGVVKTRSPGARRDGQKGHLWSCVKGTR